MIFHFQCSSNKHTVEGKGFQKVDHFWDRAKDADYNMQNLMIFWVLH